MKYYSLIILAILLATASGCKKLLDVNTDPATPQVVKAEYMLAPIIFQMANNTATDYRVLFKYTQNMFSQDVLAASVVWDRHGYVSASDLGGSLWRMAYVNFGLNLEDMIKEAEATNKWTYAGIGYAVKAWGYQMLTDAHGPVILDEAFTLGKLEFRYQDQPEVYARVREWSQKALECFNKTEGANVAALLSSPSGDQMYRGDRPKWRKFVYAVLATQYGHLVNKPEFKARYADSVVKYVNLSFANSADDATIGFNGNTSGDSNPLGQNFALFTPLAYGRIGQPIVDYLTGGVRGIPPADPRTSVDPRLTRMINPMSTTVPATNGVYRGVMPTQGDVPTVKTIPHVLGSVTGSSATPFPGKYIFANAARYPIMTYAQLQFIKSEALFTKGDLAGAYSAYIAGIRGHMDFVNTYGRNGNPSAQAITAAEIDAYLASTEVAKTAGDLKLADIMGQKYIAQWGWAGLEQWCDLRKHHYSADVFRNYKQLAEGELNDTNLGKYAYRLRPRYNSEYIWNRKELDKWGGLAPNYHTVETWFSLPNN
ncbi:SusD/RagB family nutrient-binding outer membrane lipoprotein [Pedobacter sp. SYP-B3415]|uniref:SusD/RagB family nutrient-binding outer membrane lipoprotein n=1 Tax=Pedobacter sp. SYP-B3415 TaxID=2496641 RepID=UPI00101B9593|nr:SusD/RagB family nutrient-binding outer membrane lipoprotein [Pedobacter sp. SYP-B3415]